MLVLGLYAFNILNSIQKLITLHFSDIFNCMYNNTQKPLVINQLDILYLLISVRVKVCKKKVSNRFINRHHKSKLMSMVLYGTL